MYRPFSSLPLNHFVAKKGIKIASLFVALNPISGHMKTKLLRSLQVGTLLLMAMKPFPSFCAEGKKDDTKQGNAPFSEWVKKLSTKDGINFDNINDVLAKSFEPGGPMVPLKDFFESGNAGKVGYGFMMGYSSGFCIKKVSKFIAFFVGAAFIMIQTLQYNGLIDVKYDRVEQEVTKVLDLNNDGKFDEKDVRIAHTKVQEILGYHMPAGGGFATGLYMGLRS